MIACFNVTRCKAEIDFYDCANGEYPQICEAMNNIANTLIQIEEVQK